MNSAESSADGLGLLVVSFHFPPTAEPRAIQVGNLLGAVDWPLLVARGDDPRRRPDPTLVPRLSHPQSRVLSIPYRPHPVGVRLEFHGSNYKLPLAGYSPDMFHYWRRPAVKAIRQALKDLPWRPRALITFAQPWTTHLVGLDLARGLRLPWLAHFSDLWADWPFMPGDPLTRAYNRRLEAAVVNQASRVLFTSQETLDLVMAKYPPALAAKAGLLTHSFVASDYPAQGYAPGPRRVIRYLGNFYGRRHPSLLVEPLRILRQSRPELLANLSIEIVGSYQPPSGGDNPFAGLPPGLLTFRPAVPHQDCLALMAQAEALLVIEFPVARSVWLPSKIVEYIGAGRPVLGMVPEGASRRVIEAVGGLTADPADPQAVAAMLARYLEQPAPASPWGDQAVRGSFRARSQAQRFMEEVRLALAGSTSG